MIYCNIYVYIPNIRIYMNVGVYTHRIYMYYIVVDVTLFLSITFYKVEEEVVTNSS